MTSTPSETNRKVDLSQGTIHYREDGEGPTVVFIHGLLVNHTLWDGVIDGLAAKHRCIAPDLPLGSHPQAMDPGADLSPTGVARLIAAFLEALDLTDVTLVANDTGGAMAQVTITEHPERIGRIVLTNCDAYENFLPLAFRPLQWLAWVPGAVTGVVQAMRIRALRPTAVAYGPLTRHRVPDAVLESWTRPMLSDGGVRRDVRKVLRGISPRYTLAAAEKLRDFSGPALLAWGPEDRFFKFSYAERLRDAFADGRLVPVEDALTFVSMDQPARVADLVEEFVAGKAPATA